MDFKIPPETVKEQRRFLAFLDDHMLPHLSIWYHHGAVPRSFFRQIGKAEWFGFRMINGRLVMRSAFLVNLHAEGVQRKKLNKRVWIPSDLTRIQFNNVFVPEDHLMGKQGRGLQQVLTIFTHSFSHIRASDS